MKPRQQAQQEEQSSPMWDAIAEYAQSISGLSNALMVVIWLLYLQVFLLQFRRQKRAFLVIHHAHGLSPSAACLLVNMSQETVHVQCVIASVSTKRGEYVRQVAEFHRPSAGDGGIERTLREGPLQPGHYLVLGKFEEIILGAAAEVTEEAEMAPRDDEVASPPPADLSEVESLELCAAVVHGPTNHPVGARRRFSVEAEPERFLVRPENIHTEQLTTFRKRRQVRRWVEQCLHPRQRGGWQTQQSQQSSE